MVSKEDIESTISSMLYDLCHLFRGFSVMGGGLTLRPIRPFDRLRAGGLGTQAAGRVKRCARGESRAVVGFFFVE